MIQLRTSRPLGLIPAALVALLLAACGSSGTGSTAASADGAGTDASSGGAASQSAGTGTGSSGEGACTIVSEDEVAEIIGADVAGSLGTELEGQVFCNYNDADGTPLATVAVISPNSALAPQAGYDAITEGTEDVSGIGDQAKYAVVGPSGTLYVLSDGNLYMTTIIATDVDPASNQDAAIELARLVIDRH